MIGTWRLVTYQVHDANGTSRPGAYDQGRISYGPSGQMSAQLMNSANKADRAPATDADRAVAYRRYIGYYGPFTVDEAKGIVTHHVAGSSNPAFVGTDLVRSYAFGAGDNQLTLSVKDGDRVAQTLLWERIK